MANSNKDGLSNVYLSQDALNELTVIFNEAQLGLRPYSDGYALIAREAPVEYGDNARF